MSDLWIDGQAIAGEGAELASVDPATAEIVWRGGTASPRQVERAVAAARAAAADWAETPLEERLSIARRFAEHLTATRDELAEAISRETGKVLWETRAEVGSMIGKVGLSIAAQAERAGTRSEEQPFGRSVLRHRPQGVMAVLGPYNFPGHLPNGHIVPALIAGNTIVFKPSEKTPLTGARMMAAWTTAGLPAGVLNVVQGGREVGTALLEQDVDGVLFTGSARAGAQIRRMFVDRPGVILALELGGNNPLVVWEEAQAAASIIAHSAFVTTGQRCSCARRLIVPEGKAGDRIVEALAAFSDQLIVGAWNDPVEAFMGPLIDDQTADAARQAVRDMIARGARVIRSGALADARGGAFVGPAILEVSPGAGADDEIFAPVLQVLRVSTFADAIREANATRYGLSAGLVASDPDLWAQFRAHIRAGVVNWNRPTTGAAGNMPFGGLGDSGNHRPSAYYAADYCAHPVASFESEAVAAIPTVGLRQQPD